MSHIYVYLHSVLYIIEHFHTISTYDVIFIWNNTGFFFFISMSHGADHLKLDDFAFTTPLFVLHPSSNQARTATVL